MWTAFPPSDYYRPSAPPQAIGRRRTFPADPPGGRVRGGSPKVVPTFTAFRSSGEAASFAPAASPRLRRSPSPWPPDQQDQSDPGVPAHAGGAHRNPAQIHRVRAGGGLEGLYTADSSRPPSRLACGPTPSGSPGASRRCRGCSPPSPVVSPDPAAPSFYRSAATDRRRGSHTRTRITAPRGARSPTSTRFNSASRRTHDLRHTFAVRTLLGWYRAGEDAQAKIPALSTYLGHREPSSTYWYLSAAPELLALAAARQDNAWSAARS
jgi:hypothetical protein